MPSLKVQANKVARFAHVRAIAIDHFHIHFETEALSLTERRAMMLYFFRKETLHDFSTSTKLTALFGIKRQL